MGCNNNNSNTPWVEKYRPVTIDDIAHQAEVVSSLKSALTSNNLPHLMFYGPPGTGKTSCILAVAKQLFGPKLYRDRVLELNASDERGIDVVRSRIKMFARFSVGASTDPDYPCPPFKIIILDEADSMTRDAQAALRRTMELYCKVTRFCIICNYVSKMIEPLCSRCAKFRFQPIEDATHRARLLSIAKEEDLVLDEPALAALLECADGDLRRSITLMQSCKSFYGSVSAEAVENISGDVPSGVVDALIKVCRTGDIEAVELAVQDTTDDGFASKNLLLKLLLALIKLELPERVTVQISQVFSLADERFTQGSDEGLQLLWVCTELAGIFESLARC